MAWTTMHFAVGMGCTGAAVAVGCAIARRGWRWWPASMTLGGLWACIPDAPRFFREDFPDLPLATTLGAKTLERALHAVGDLFFFHKALDAQPRELALHGVVLILLFYNLAIAQLMWMERRQRNSLANRTWRAHGSRAMKRSSRRRRRHAQRDKNLAPDGPVPRSEMAGESDESEPVLFRITPGRDAQGQ